jgi:hypothetical protein
MSYCLSVIVGVSLGHPDAITALLGFYPVFIDGEVAASFDLQIARIALGWHVIRASSCILRLPASANSEQP